jgi:hypothetical protein
LVLDFEDSDFLEPGAQPRVLQSTQSEGIGPTVREAPRRGVAPQSAPAPTQDRPAQR